MLNLGQKIKQVRKVRGITQDDLAKAIGVSDKSISAYESDRISPPIKVLEKIAKKTDLSVGYFLENNDSSEILAKLKSVEKLFEEIRNLLKK